MRDVFPTCDAPSADELVAQLLELPEARGLALDALTRLASIEWDDGVATACVECAASPRLLLNPQFVAARCTSTRRLAFLVLHELAHVSLGHSGLHSRVTAAQNVAHDAIINASLLQGLASSRSADGWDALVNEFYAPNESPFFLLRPPPGWPARPDWEASLGTPDALRQIHRRLYGARAAWPAPADARWQGVTYGEIVAALEGTDAALSTSDATADGLTSIIARLLGAHAATEREQAAESGGRDQQLASLLSAVLGRLPRDPGASQGPGGDPLELRIARVRPVDQLVAALRRLFMMTLVDTGQHRKARADVVPAWSADPSRDRRAAVRRFVARSLGGSHLLLYRSESTRVRSTPDGRTAIYLDVSGSMSGVLERLHASLVPLRRLIAPKVFVFSTVVEELQREKFMRGHIRTTGGTSVDPVLEHLTAEACAGRVRKAVLLTDGWFCPPSARVLRRYLASQASLHLGIIGTPAHSAEPWVASETRLPDVASTRSY
jgi:hypothetical protein